MAELEDELLDDDEEGESDTSGRAGGLKCV